MILDSYNALREFEDAEIVCLDIETTGLNPWKDNIAVSSFASPDKETAVIQTPGGFIDDNLRQLFSKRGIWITHNGTGFDLLFFANQDISLPFGRHYDTLIGEQTLGVQNRRDIRHDLGSVMKRRLGRNAKMDVDHSTWQNEKLTEQQLKYAAADVEYLLPIMEKQIELSRERGLSTALSNEQKLTTIVAEIADNGMAISIDELNRMQQLFMDQAAEAMARLPRTLNVNSPKQVKEFLHSKGIMVDSTAKDILIMRPEPECADILTVRPALKRSGFYDDDWRLKYVEGGKVRSRYRQLGTATTRFSSADPNLQQIPRDMRGMFGHEEGLKVVALDYAQLEVRIAAHLSQDKELMRALESEDFHVFMAQAMLSKQEISSPERRDGKAGTFTWIFAGGVQGIQAMGRQQGVYISDQMASKMLRGLKRRFKRVSIWHNRAYSQINQRRNVITVVLPWDHQRQFLRKDQRAQAIINTQVQGRAAIGLKEALFEARRRGLTKYIGGLVHDEIVATSVPANEADDFAHELAESMHDGMVKVCDSVPIKIDADIGDYWIP